MDPFLCLDSTPNLFSVLDTTVAPPLLYYSYLPIVFVSLFFSVFLFIKNRSIQTKALLAIALIFALWIGNEIIQWIAVDAWLVHFAWQMSALLQTSLVASVVYFVYIFIHNSKPPFVYKLTSFFLLIPVILSIPTALNMTSFDLVECQSYNGPIWFYIYSLQALAALSVIFLCVKKYQTSIKADRKQTLYLGFATTILLGLFVLTNIAGDATLVYEFNLLGPLGMVLFISFLAYMIVRFKAFNVKLFGAQMLVSALVSLVFAILFIRRIENVRIVTILTLILTGIIGTFLVKSVKREVEARELIEKQKESLEKANTRLRELDIQKTEFVSFATHQLRSPLTSIKGNTSLILEGDAGSVPEPVKNIVEVVYTSIKTMGSIVEDYLNMSRIELGTMKYTLVDMDFKDLLTDVMNEQKINIEAKGLTYAISFDATQTFRIKADPDKFKQVVMNTIDNSIKYTPKGSLSISLSKDPAHKVIRLKIADTGVGIKPEVMPKLFRKFSRAPDASAANIHGTGLGLFIAKEIMNAHGGKIWAESEGEGKGSQFYVEIPEVK